MTNPASPVNPVLHSEGAARRYSYPGVWVLVGTSPRMCPEFVRRVHADGPLVVGLGRMAGLGFPVHAVALNGPVPIMPRTDLRGPLTPVFLPKDCRVNQQQIVWPIPTRGYYTSLLVGMAAALDGGATRCILHGVDLLVDEVSPYFYTELTPLERITSAKVSAEKSRKGLPELLALFAQTGVPVQTTDPIEGLDIPVVPQDEVLSRRPAGGKQPPAAVIRRILSRRQAEEVREVAELQGKPPTPTRPPRDAADRSGVLPPAHLVHMLAELGKRHEDDIPDSMRETIRKIGSGCSGCVVKGNLPGIRKILEAYPEEIRGYIREKHPSVTHLHAKLELPSTAAGKVG